MPEVSAFEAARPPTSIRPVSARLRVILTPPVCRWRPAGILHLYDEQLRAMEFINLAQFLTGLPDDLDSEALFKSITKVHTCIGKQTFHDLLERNRRSSPLDSPR